MVYDLQYAIAIYTYSYIACSTVNKVYAFCITSLYDNRIYTINEHSSAWSANEINVLALFLSNLYMYFIGRKRYIVRR